ncbi:hypothetical protein ACWENQ_31630 [Nonomuraea sp. NPDC004354]
MRARDLPIVLDGRPGRWNAITDVPGVEVGYVTRFPSGRSGMSPAIAAAMTMSCI